MFGDSASELIDQFGSETFKAVHDSEQDGLIYFAGDGTIEYANRAALELFGGAPDLIGDNIFALVEERSDELTVELIFPSDHFEKARKTYEQGTPHRSEMIVVDGDDRREIEVIWGAVRHDGTLTGVVGSYRDVSPRPDIHDQLSSEASRLDEQRRFLASIINVLDDGVLVFDGQGALLLANPAALELMGLDPPVEGLDLEVFLERSKLGSPRQFTRQLRRTMNSGESSTEMQFIDRGDGDVRRIEFEMSRAEYDRERLICRIADRTQRIDVRHMELLSEIARLDRLALQFDDLGDRALEAIVDRLEVDFAILARENDGELVPFAWRGVMLDRDMRVDIQRHPSIERGLEEGQPVHLEEWIWRRHTDEETLEQLVIPLVTANSGRGTLHLGYGSELQARNFGTDAIERAFTEALGHFLCCALAGTRHAERRATEQSRLRSLVEAIPEGILVYNRRGDVVLSNTAVVEMTEFDDWENLNTDDRPFRILGPSGDPMPRSDWPFLRAVREEAHCSAELTLDFGHSRRTLVVEAAPLEATGETDELFVGTLRDVTQERKLSRRKDEFLSIASHELRSPLTPLTGILQLARRQRERGNDVDLSLLTRAERQVSRLTRLIDGLLDLTRIENDRIDLDTRPIEVTSFIEDRVHPWRLHPKDVSLEVSVPDAQIQAELDPDRINQVLTNVVDNAIEYSKPNEVIRIEVSETDSDVRLVVEDDGAGMDQETVDRIFDRFYHGGEQGGGARSMGLGLYICRQIIEEHHGEIDVESEPGEGTRVEIEVPKTQPESRDH